MPRLVVLRGPLKGNVYPLDLERWQTDELVLGRSKDCHILLHDAKVSKRHLRLFREGGRWQIEDLGSRNGVHVNGAKVLRAALSSGDEIQVGDAVFSFLEDEPAGGTTTPSAPTRTQGEAPARRTKPALRALSVSSAPATAELRELVEQVEDAARRIRSEIGKVVVGQNEVIDSLLIGLLARGHCLIEGVPGLAKTLLVSTLAAVLDLDFKRVQFTPDLMPADITGTDVLEENPVTRERSYKFIRGPIFTNILLADEINRTPPKTQAALLEAMQEFRVTASGTTYTLTPPFYVLATQNPIEQEGTYPLPEAQLDRFMFKVKIDYPSRDEEVEIVRATTLEREEEPEVVLGADDILRLQRLVRTIPVSDYVLYYAADLARATRPSDPSSPGFVKQYLSWGAGPRAAQYLILGAKAKALLDGRANVTAADVRSVAREVLRHRISLNFHAASEGLSADDVIARLLEKLPEPKEAGGRKP